MKRALRAAAVLCAVALAAPISPAGSGQAPVERRLFKDLDPSDPVRVIVRTVLDSRRLSLRDALGGAAWRAEGHAAAWDRARRYFPGLAYYVVPGTYFMTHGFDAGGRLFMEVHDSEYLRLCVENLATFAPGAVVDASVRMSQAPDAGPAAAFAAKLGRLEPFCRDETALRGLRKALGDKPLLGLLEGLRQENYHMIAGGLMHEGRHAGLDEALIARLRADFEAGRAPVLWDEVLAFAGEAGYHLAYVRWAAAEIAAAWSQAEGRLGQLEALRREARLDRGAGRIRFERARASAWAAAALVRLRMREIWQSARRGQDLAAGLRRDYVRDGAPPDAAAALAGFARESAGFVAAAGEAIQRTELALRSLEALLDTWSEWADGRRPFPPPMTDSRAVMTRAKGIRWPGPEGEATKALRELAAAALAKERRPG